MIPLLANSLVMIGAGFHIFSLAPIRQLVAQLPAGSLRRRWYLLRVLIYSFIAGYLGYILVYWNAHEDVRDLVVPVVFFLGGWFVLLVSYLSLQTASDVRRLTILEEENITDPLMDIYNRRYLDRRLADEVARAQRYNMPLSILMIDIDHFKKVNDTHGHQVGDQILRQLGKLITDTVRTTDIVARYGGEEIVVITPNSSAETAAKLAERLRMAVESATVATEQTQDKKRPIRVTVSIGVAFLGEDISDARTLIHRADEALYSAKNEGRNCVVVHG